MKYLLVAMYLTGSINQSGVHEWGFHPHFDKQLDTLEDCQKGKDFAEVVMPTFMHLNGFKGYAIHCIAVDDNINLQTNEIFLNELRRLRDQAVENAGLSSETEQNEEIKRYGVQNRDIRI